MIYIDSRENNTLKKLKKLKTKKYRDQEKKFLAEGVKFFDFDIAPEYIIIDEAFSQKKEILEKVKKFPESTVIILSENLFAQLSSQENSQGVILVYKYTENDINKIENNVIVLDKVGDPGNLGTIIRTADAAGFKDIILTKGSVDCYNEKVVRSTMGSIFNINLYYVEEEFLLKFLKEKNYKLISTVLSDDCVPYTKMKLEERNAIIFGNEGNGIGENIINSSDEKVIIPIYGTAESLNVAMACGIIIYKCREILSNNWYRYKKIY